MANRLVWCALFCASLCCGSALNADDEDDEFQPGLVAVFRAGERSVARIHSDIAFAWDDAAPDPILPVGPFEANWRGLLLVRQEGKHRLHAFVQGEVTVEIDGRRVLHGSAKQPQWISGDEFLPGFAERPLVVTFRKTEKTAQLKLFWSSDTFSLEPLPPELLFHDPSRLGLRPDPAAGKEDASQTQGRDGVPTYALIERGRQQFAAFRCGRCHVREGDAIAPIAPSLQHVASGMTVELIARRLAPAMNTSDATAPDRRMPHFRLNQEQARHLAAFLVKQSESVKLDEAKTIKPKTPKEGETVVTSERRGELLLRSVGCLACHRVGELGNSNELPFAGPDLTHVRQRRSASWLTTWLADPQRLNADHRMPIFALTEEERHLIVMALTALPLNNEGAGYSLRSGASDPTKVSGAISGSKRIRPQTSSTVPTNNKPDDSAKESPVDAGRRLFVEHRCAACHRTIDPKLNEFARPKSDLSRPTDWSTGCLDEQWASDDAKQPIYLRGLDRAAIKAFLASRWDRSLSRESQFVRGTRMLEEKNCFACHPRHGGIGLGRTAKLVVTADKELNGQAPSLVAPSLNAIGDKLLDEALSIAVRGERQPIRMLWLKVRMPKFKHSPDELATLTRYFVEHDRIPFVERGGEGETRGGGEKQKAKTSTAVLSPSPTLPVSHSAETHLAGQALTGVRGWSCIACHKIGDYEPKQVALGARGSDLKMLGKHIRPEFFFRWIASPLRVIPGVEMPSYLKPVAGVLDGDLSKQHASLWQALNDPNFQPPTNPANVEQLWVVNPGERPRIVRDVFQLPKELGGGNVPRSFAVGFDNGHSLLFDAETASVRQWTFGDFARQQVVGKRWFWQMAGVDVLRSLPAPQFALRRKSDSKAHVLMASIRNHEPMGNCRVDASGVHLSYLLYFVIDEEPDDIAWEDAPIRVEETLTPITGDARGGVQRKLSLTWTRSSNTSDFELWFARPAKRDGVGEPRIDLVGWALLPVRGDRTESKTAEVKTETGTGKSAHPTWRALPVRDLPDDAWEWTELPLRHSSTEPLPTTQVTLAYTAELSRQPQTVPVRPVIAANSTVVATVPGFNGVQLPLDASLMPTGFAWRPNGQLVLSSLKGHVFAAADSNADGLEDRLTLLHEGLSAPYGVNMLDESVIRSRLGKDAATIRDSLAERSVLVASRHDLALLVDLDGDGYCERQVPIARDWGLTDDYHEWTTSPVLDSKYRLIWGLSSDYTDKSRLRHRSRWRGKVMRLILDSRGYPREEGAFSIGPHPIGHAFRYPTGIAINERDEVFVSDQQGVQNCFNEINFLVEGAHYGVPSTHEEDKDAAETKAAIQIPHPWTRSVNGLCFLTGHEGYPDLKGHGIGCEYNGRFLIRFTTQRVGDVMQGAVYPFSQPDYPKADENFQGPLVCGVSPKGEIYIGSISDSGWIGGNNTGSIVKLKANGQRPNGIREIRATREGFDIEFFAPVDRARAKNGENYSISGYTRVWGGAYATPDSDRHRCKVLAVELSEDGQTAKLKVDSRKTPNYVYDISCRDVADPDKPYFPSYGFFTLHKIP